jgi:hypothetical protein
MISAPAMASGDPGGTVAESMEFATPPDDARSLRRQTMAEQPP